MHKLPIQRPKFLCCVMAPFSAPDVSRGANGKKRLGIGKFLKTLKRDLKRSSGTSKNNKNKLTHNLNNLPRVG